MDIVVIVITVLSGALVVYHHALYPLLLKKLARINTARSCAENSTENSAEVTAHTHALPTITIVVPAYNEQQWIAEKIRNLAALNYPAELVHIIIACDGCRDNTAQIAVQTLQEPICRDANITVKNFLINRGKVAVINDVVSRCYSDLVMLTDVSALLSIDALTIAAQRFADNNIGVVNSRYCLWQAGSAGEALYWRYQSDIKQCEANLGSTLGTHGACYVFRRRLFTPLPGDTINDDFILPMSIVAQGFRSVQEHNLIALEMEASDEQMDFNRRIRISAGNLQQLWRLKTLLHPKHGWLAFNFASGKALRVLMPYLMLLALIGSLWLAPESWLFALLAGLQILVYSLAVWGIGRQSSHRITKALAYLVAGHAASLWGSLRYAMGLERGRWHRITQTPQP
ncbi:glycosyltransferase family 2 protein [Bacterioplanes sanyensis]|nr:glycosyltransferase family 2 protein [Bacterioplanes sanyensis]